MRTFDFSPLYRTTVGFDHLASLLDAVSRYDNTSTYPPYNIELLEDDEYRITMAVAGFVEDELDIQVEKQALTISGRRAEGDDVQRNYLHQGIAARNFERRFQLADHVKVTGARLENGMLHVDLAREIPEEEKPKTIPIGTGDSKLIDVDKQQDQAAA